MSDIEQHIQDLEAENEELRQLLNSKRYRIINAVVNRFYSVKNQKNVAIEKSKALITPKVLSKRRIESGRVDIINVNFYDWDGKVVYKGGAERYVFDLACLLKKMGYKPRIIQGANVDFEKKFNNIPVIGIKCHTKDMFALSKIYNSFCKNAELIIASPLELASKITCGVPIIGINHGINFDSENNAWRDTSSQTFSEHYDALKVVKRCVCVDTNFINWVRTRDYSLSNKLDYIPNYYDSKTFKQVKKKPSNNIRFVYPRRIYAARGYDIVLEAFKKLLTERTDIELHLVGQFDTDLIKNSVEQDMKKFPKNIFHSEYDMDEMYKAYENADVVVIPTKFSEGTSLSCIEGLASGAAVIATVVGGLPNLIIDHYNGLLVNPTASSIEKAMRELLSDKKLIDFLSSNGVSVAMASFEKTAWDNRWTDIISGVTNKRK